MAKSTRIADTTREERIQIVTEALSWGEDCGDCTLDACGIDKYYEPYIEGEMELAELNMLKATKTYELSGNDRGNVSESCPL
ncbi:MAG: hypothetical protein ACOYJL_03095 [Tractidigestivibacter sp.]|jgi:hypothetical protein|uniref:hypothetical protein n=1 Tax=Tractidigestivibacter sp. TaxID=2847320 RepID=UPI003D8D35DC